ncbi:hypothetical protein B5F15_15070 [Butyricicoccus pullicaecorum]|uniref:Uncharacterized protein n=1 Tax=Butyricicoccus pullicaecorum TaxID=501571 RepID=A0A1Y4LHC7_9FIRM|nr:hypothetical protein B5F15_15070 [Butyricicoccus pullicaecorum]
MIRYFPYEKMLDYFTKNEKFATLHREFVAFIGQKMKARCWNLKFSSGLACMNGLFGLKNWRLLTLKAHLWVRFVPMIRENQHSVWWFSICANACTRTEPSSLPASILQEEDGTK